MEKMLKQKFLTLWKKYFNNADLPFCFYYTDDEHFPAAKPGSIPRCIIGALSEVRKGVTLIVDSSSIGCAGGKRYTGYSTGLMPNFEYFLSCGIPGKLEGERYKKSPELVKEVLKEMPVFKAPGRYMVFKRWDMLEERDNPEVAIFYPKPDVLSGLFTLAGFDDAGVNSVIVPFGSGCSSIIQYPYLEKSSNNPRAIMGMLDVSARPFVPQEIVSFSMPTNKLLSMVDNMEESFLTTESWRQVQKRIA
jgi:hypothetical protein